MAHEALAHELKEKLSELELRLQAIKNDVTQSHSADFEEQATERENDEVVDSIGNETRVAIQAVKTALSKIDNGSYGECETCGNQISSERLKAVPEAAYCIDCAD